MADYITTIRTIDGDRQIDYNALANLPDLSEKSNIDHKHTASEVGALSNKGGYLYGTLTVLNTLTTKGIVLTEGVDFGSKTPSGGVLGQVYFKKVT